MWSGIGVRSLRSRTIVSKIANFIRLVDILSRPGEEEFAGHLTSIVGLLLRSSDDPNQSDIRIAVPGPETISTDLNFPRSEPISADKKNLDISQLSVYLNGQCDISAAASGSVVREIRMAAGQFHRQYGSLIDFVPVGPRLHLQLRDPSSTEAFRVLKNPRSLFKDLFMYIDAFHLRAWTDASRQGRYAASLAVSPLSSVSDRRLSFCDWRFIHRARLNLIPTNSNNSSATTKSCRRCGAEIESLSHVLNSCKSHSRLWIKRHNSVLNLLVELVKKRHPSFDIAVNRQFDKTNLRPDIVIKDQSTMSAAVIDVKTPIDLQARCEQVNRESIDKYQPVFYVCNWQSWSQRHNEYCRISDFLMSKLALNLKCIKCKKTNDLKLNENKFHISTTSIKVLGYVIKN